MFTFSINTSELEVRLPKAMKSLQSIYIFSTTTLHFFFLSSNYKDARDQRKQDIKYIPRFWVWYICVYIYVHMYNNYGKNRESSWNKETFAIIIFLILWTKCN